MIKKALISLAICCSTTVFAADIFKADSYYTSQKYQLAYKEYMKATERGNPHAFYQLGTMYHKGLGVERDPINTLLFFSLAAEYDFQKSKQFVDKIWTMIPESRHTEIKSTIAHVAQQLGEHSTNKRLFPVVIPERLGQKITFEGDAVLDNKYFGDDVEGEEYGIEEELGLDEGLTLVVTSKKQPFLVVDHDLYKDGSIRNVTEVQKLGNVRGLQKDFELFPIKQPLFNGKPVDFVSRAFIGAAVYDKFTMRRENESMFHQIRKLGNTLRAGTTISDRYYYAMAMLSFTWLEQEEGQAEQLLLELANEGHPAAMYEYGLKLYREQRDIETAIAWITMASKYGLERAEYRIAKILQSSPWVINDEKKALYWYDSAKDKGNVAAAIRATEIRLLSDKLYDWDQAWVDLKFIEQNHVRNPEYYYLLALAHKDKENRDFRLVVQNLEKAISLGETRHYDMSEWEALLSKLTTGSFYIHDDIE